MRATAGVLCALLFADPARACTPGAAADKVCKDTDKKAPKCVGTACECNPATDATTDPWGPVPPATATDYPCPKATPRCDITGRTGGVTITNTKKCGACATATPAYVVTTGNCIACTGATTAYDKATNICKEPKIWCQNELLAKCASTPGEGLLGDAAHCNACIITNMPALQLATCDLGQMQSFCALAPKKAAPGPTPVPEQNECSKAQIKAMWSTWEDYCVLPGPKAAATPHGCDKLVYSLDPTDPMKHAVDDCQTQTESPCYIFDLDGSRCHGDSATNIFNCRRVPDAQKRNTVANNQNWLRYCEASVPKSYAMTSGCSKGAWDASGVEAQKKAVDECQKTDWKGSGTTVKCVDEVGDWLDVCTQGKVQYDKTKCTQARERKCKCAPYDVDGAGCSGKTALASAPAPHHHDHHHHHHHHHGHKHHYKAWDADEEVRAEGSGTASAYSYLPVACVAVAVLAGVAFVVRRCQTSELPAAQAAGYGTVPP